MSVSRFQIAFNFNSSGLSVPSSYTPALAPRFAPKYMFQISINAGSWYAWGWTPWNGSDVVTLSDTGSDGELLATIAFTVTDPAQSAGITWHSSQCSFTGATTTTLLGGDNSPLPIQLAENVGVRAVPIAQHNAPRVWVPEQGRGFVGVKTYTIQWTQITPLAIFRVNSAIATAGYRSRITSGRPSTTADSRIPEGYA